MIDSGDAKDVVIKVIDTKPENRSWVLSLVIIVILAGGDFFFYSSWIYDYFETIIKII